MTMVILSKDRLFRILSNSRRRQILHFLHRAGEAISLKELVAMVVARENGTAIEDVINEERQRVYISLHQTHPPKLESAGLVDYDEKERSIELAPNVAKRGLFWIQSGVNESWSRYYTLLGTLSWVLILGPWAGLPGFAPISWGAVATFVFAVLLVLVFAYYLSERNGGTSADAFEALVK